MPCDKSCNQWIGRVGLFLLGNEDLCGEKKNLAILLGWSRKIKAARPFEAEEQHLKTNRKNIRSHIWSLTSSWDDLRRD